MRLPGRFRQPARLESMSTPVKKSITIKEVAREAQVSVATVSRALNNPGRVSPRTATLVRSVAERLDYIPSRIAGSMVSKRFRAIGAVVPTIDNPIFAKALHALQSRLDESGYNLLVSSAHYDYKREASALQSLIEHGVDAVVLVGAKHHPDVARMLKKTGMPFVYLWVYEPASPFPCIGLDNKGAMFRLTNYLLDLGHRKFALIAGLTEHNDRAQQRRDGALEALRLRGVEIDAHHIVESSYSIAAGRHAMRTVLALDEQPTAVICGNDILAFGAVFECLAQGIPVPERYSIAGFDDFELSTHMVPSLTTVHVPAIKMGTAAADYLLATLRDQPAPRHMEFEAPLIVRGSTAPPGP
jgi:LacI family transcriptional regulator